MNCIEVRQHIDKLDFDTNIEPAENIKLHIDTCSDCRKYYEEHLQTSGIISKLKNQNPELQNPEKLKSSILASIELEEQNTGKKTIPIMFFTRILTAALVALLITLGTEQYTVLQKVQHLEIQLGKIDHNTLIQENRLYKSSLIDIETLLSKGKPEIIMKKLALMLRLQQIENSNFTYDDLKRNMYKDENLKKIIDSHQ